MSLAFESKLEILHDWQKEKGVDDTVKGPGTDSHLRSHINMLPVFTHKARLQLKH